MQVSQGRVIRKRHRTPVKSEKARTTSNSLRTPTHMGDDLVHWEGKGVRLGCAGMLLHSLPRGI